MHPVALGWRNWIHVGSQEASEKKARISPFLNFLGGGELKELISDEDSAALQNWVIQTLAKEMRSEKNPSIATRRDLGLIAALCAASFKRNSSKMAGKLPQNRGPRSASVGHGNRGTMLRYLLALLACLERAPG